MNKFFILALFATAACAIPHMDEVAPEIELPSKDAELDLLQSSAHAEAVDLMQKKGANACEDLANATEDEVEKNVEVIQEALNKINKGKDCPTKGAKEVAARTTELNDAKAKVQAAQKTKKQADEEQLDFGKYRADQLDGSSCRPFYTNHVWSNSQKRRKAANNALQQAKGVETQANKELQAAKDAAAKAVKECQCEVKKLHKTELDKSNERAYSANIKAWTKAAHLKCVLKGTKISNCKVPTMPKVKAVTVDKGVTDVNCNPEQLLTDSCQGVRYCRKGDTASNTQLVLQTYQNNIWNRNKVYHCPNDFYWGTAQQYKNLMGAQRCQNGVSGTTQYNTCGWSGYNPPAGSGNTATRVFLRFRDSNQNGCYQHTGNGFFNVACGDYTTSSFAGIICLRKGNSNAGGDYNRSEKGWGSLSLVPNTNTKWQRL